MQVHELITASGDDCCEPGCCGGSDGSTGGCC